MPIFQERDIDEIERRLRQRGAFAPASFVGMGRLSSAGVLTLIDGVVPLASIATIATATVLGNNSGADASPIALTAAQTKTLLAITTGDVSGLGSMATQNASAVAITGGTIAGLTGFAIRNAGTGVFDMTVAYNGTLTAARTLTWNLNDAARTVSLSGNLTVSSAATVSGTNTGDQTIALTGDVTGSGVGSFAATIAASAVTLAKMADVATASVFYRKTAGTGAPEVQTLATLKTDLGLTGTNTGDETGARIATINHAATVKSALLDADEITGQDSAASFGLIRTTWTSVKAFLKTYFDTLYDPIATTGTTTATATFGGGITGFSWSSQTLTWKRTGNSIVWDLPLVFSAKGSSTGVMAITGLPVNALANTVCPIRITNPTSGVGDTHLQALILAGTTTIRIDKVVAGSAVQLTDADITATTQIHLSGSYRV